MRINSRVLIASGLLSVIAIYGAVRIFAGSDDFAAGAQGVETSITVGNGEVGSSIAQSLFKAGVIKSAKTFTALAISDKRSQSIAPGIHTVHTHIPNKQALVELLDQKRLVGVIVVKEGSTVSDVVAVLRANRNIDNSHSATAGIKGILAPSLEGELFPAHYSFAPGTPSSTAIKAMLAKFASSTLDSGVLRGYGKYSAYQVLTIASMVQVEGDPDVYAKVARVIYNRLSIGMPLQLNSTVQFAANLRGQIHLSTKSTQINSPYNTYRVVGLPPTPINNPSLAAIAATQKPADGDWLYFITVKPRDTRFTKSFDVFQGWVTEFNKNRAAGAFK